MPLSTKPPDSSMRAVSPTTIRVAFHLRAGDNQQRDGGAAAIEQAGDLRHLDEAQLRRREHHHVDGLDRLGVALLKFANIGLADVVAAHRASRSENLVEAAGFGRESAGMGPKAR